MQEVIDDDEVEIELKRPFHAKFMKELNYMQNQKNKKIKRKMRQQKQISPHKLEKLQNLGIKPNLKTLRKLPQSNRNGNKIYANWKNNQINGQAQIYYSNGVTFKGIYQNGIKVKGHFQFLHGYEFIGNCLGNKFNGQGSLIFPSGKVITGQWRDYNITEKGKIEYPNGEVYYGQIKDLKKHGKGYLFFKDGSKYVGEFQGGQIMGQGTYYIDDEVVSSGNWVEGELQEEIDLSKIVSEQQFQPNKGKREGGCVKKSEKNLGKNISAQKGKSMKKLRFAQKLDISLKGKRQTSK